MSSRWRDKDKEYINYRKLFPEPPDGDYSKLQIDAEALMYITTPYNAKMICSIVQNNLQNLRDLQDLRDLRDYAEKPNTDMSKICVFDMMGGVCGDTIEFGKTFGSVISCEKDISRFSMLRTNVGVYGLSNVELHNKCSLTLLPDILNTNAVDVVYMDPPWGGKSYKDSALLTLSIDGRPIEDVIREVITSVSASANSGSDRRVKLIVLKLPKNYDIAHLYYETKKPNTTVLMYELQKMLIIIYKL